MSLRSMLLRHLWALVFAAPLVSGSQAQVDNVMVYGTVKDMNTAKKLDGVTITVYKNGAKLTEVITNASGKYEVNLDYGADYNVGCSKAGFVGKNISIDTRNVPEEERLGGHGMNIDFTMMVELQGVDYAILKEPFGKANYQQASGNFEWDMEYTARMRDAQARLLKEYEDRKKREANAEAEFAKMMLQGETAMAASDYKKAVASFTSALELKPGDAVATAKLSDARMALDAEEGTKKIEEQYAALIKEADGLFTKKDYEGAKAKYDAAIDLKDDQPYPKQRIKEIEGILADLAKKAEEERLAKELQEKYQAAITAADAAFNAGKWDAAGTKYTEASGFKPEEKYPKDQLAAIVKKREEEARKAEEERLAKELNEKYQAAITAGDAAFKAGNWDVATSRYTEAGGLKPDEQYPKDQLAAITARKSEEQQAKELDERYRAAVAAGDAAFKAEDLDQATAKFTEASELKPSEGYPKDQLAAIQRRRDELARQAEEELRARELDEQYQALIADGDAAFQGEQWEVAIAKFTEAGGLKPAEKYPKDQLAAVRKRQDELARQADEERRQRELDERYQAAIDAADQAFGAEDWTTAMARYTDAAAIKPGETYPKDQMTAVQQRMADAEARRKQEEVDARYEALIAEADEAFGSADYAAAKGKYLDAAKVKPQETYPQERLSQIEGLLADAAARAAEEQRLKELNDRYDGFIARADAAFGKEDWSAALNGYKDAAQLKPEESYPQERITAIQGLMDEAAQAKAEEERLAREQQELEKRYNDLVAAGDQAFNGDRFEDARLRYREALELKPGERHPQDRLAEMDRLEADQLAKAEAERLAAERDAEERARREEEERLAAEQAAAEKARLAEEERMRQAAAAEVEARYRELVTAADKAYEEQDYEGALGGYRDALAVKPEGKHARSRIEGIEAMLARERQAQAEAERLAEEQRRAEEERIRREQEEAEAARIAAEEERQRAEEEKRRLELEEAEARRLAEEQERMEREAAKALDERYRASVLAADEALASKNYLRARGLFAEASDMKPDETYPITKMEQIDQLLEELERKQQEQASRRTGPVQHDRQRPAPSYDSRKEQEAEQFMRAAREREEAEKYERIRRLKSDLEEREVELAADAGERRMDGVRMKEQHQAGSDRLYQGDDGRRMRNAEELQAYRDALARTDAEREQQAAEERERNYDRKLSIQEEKARKAGTWEQRQDRRNQDVAAYVDVVQRTEARRAEAGMEEARRQREVALDKAGEVDAMQERGGRLAEEQRRIVEDEKRAQQLRQAALTSSSEETRMRAREELLRIQPDQPKPASSYNRSRLAMDYPPGVTEESYTEGNKVVIRRVVVNGNRADEYSKVIAKWGTFYFKNGQSITEAIWSKETEG